MCLSSALTVGPNFLKGSNATSGRGTSALPPTGRSSDKPRPTPTSGEQFALSGHSNPPDPDFNAYRKDLADVALAGRVIASHYAEPLDCRIATPTALRTAPSNDAETIRDLAAGEPFAMLDDSLGWAWGYAGEERRVGYVPHAALGD
jgi:hypothetical protein